MARTSVVEARAARLPDQGAPHADRAWNALLNAFDHPLSEHEPQQMSDFLKNFIGIAGQFTMTTGEASDDENVDTFQERAVNLFEVLWDETAPGSIGRLQVVLNWSDVLRYQVKREDDAFDRL